MRATKLVVLGAIVTGSVVGIPGGPEGADASSGGVTEYPVIDDTTGVGDIVAGPDGRLWFSEDDHFEQRDRLGAITTSGVLTEYPVPHEVDALVSGPGGALWIASSKEWGLTSDDEPDFAPRISRVTTSGTVTDFLLPGTDITDGARDLVVGPDGNIWYTRFRGRIGRLTPAGDFTEYTVPPPEPGSLHVGGQITVGSDGALWFVELFGNRIGRVTTDGTFTMYEVPGVGFVASDMVTGPDGNVWFSGGAVFTISPQGAITEVGGVGARDLVVGPDSNIWAASSFSLTRIGPDGELTEHPAGELRQFEALATGPDGRLWFAQEGGYNDEHSVDSSIGALTMTPVPTGEFTSLTPARILDTRDGTGRNGNTSPLGNAASFDVQVAGVGGVPATGVSAVVLNATVTAPTAGSYLTVWPAGIPRPEISNLNYVPGLTVPNLVTTKVGAGGKVSVFNGAGSAHVIFDVVGYHSDASGPFGARFRPVEPQRLFDTRDGTGGVPDEPVGPNGTLRVDVTDQAGIPPADVTGVVLNVAVTEPSAGGFLTVYPDGVSRPLASNLNFVPGQTVPNLVTVQVPASGQIAFYNAVGTTHLLADVVGYYTTDVLTNEGRYVPLAPQRVEDTRRWDPIGEDDAIAVTVAGRGTMPALDVGVAVMNVTVTEPTDGGFLTVFPEDLCEVPYASNLNFGPGQTVPNLVMTRLSEPYAECGFGPGLIGIYNAVGDTHVIVDVFGYFTDDSLTAQ